METHAIETALAVLAGSALSGLGGVILGARITTRSHRTELQRERRVSAAIELGRSWAAALFAIDEAISARELDCDLEAVTVLILAAHRQINDAVTTSLPVDLLFGTTSWSSANTNAVRNEAREALRALQNDEVQAARRLHLDASLSQSYLIVALSEAIESTGSRGDMARTFREALDVRELDPTQRRRYERV